MAILRTSNIEVKKINRNRIFRFVCKYERVSKPEIAAALGLSIPTVLQNINELINTGLVQEVGELKSTGGRKASAISVVKNSYNAIGIDITKNHIGLILSDLSGELLLHKRVNQPYSNTDGYYKILAEILVEFKNEYVVSDKNFLGIGISIPGIINIRKNRIVRSHTLNITDIGTDIFCKFIDFPCFFINDANAGGFAEIYHEKENPKAVYLSISNTVGGVFIKDSKSYLSENPIADKLFLGDNFRGGEFGHMTLFPNGKKCYCGKHGCVDAYCSTQILSRHTGGNLDNFFYKLSNKDNNSEKIWDLFLSNLAIEINNLRMIFDCKIIIGGYISNYIEPYLPVLRGKAEKLNTFECDASYIQVSYYRVEALALGAALQQIEIFVESV